MQVPGLPPRIEEIKDALNAKRQQSGCGLNSCVATKNPKYGNGHQAYKHYLIYRNKAERLEPRYNFRIYKREKKTSCENYKGISLLCTCNN